MVLAHNEEGRRIGACLDSILEADATVPFAVYVMANGCTDATESIVEAYRVRDPRVHLVSIAVGDKCNAWNVFVHEVVPKEWPQPGHLFFHGRRCARDPRLVQRHGRRTRTKESDANAVGAPPASGRALRNDRDALLRDGALVANDALRGSFVERCRAARTRIPLKLEGDDGLIGR